MTLRTSRLRATLAFAIGMGAAALSADPPALPDALRRDPLKGLSGLAGEVKEALAAAKTDEPVQEKQKTITGTLDALIEAMERDCPS